MRVKSDRQRRDSDLFRMPYRAPDHFLVAAMHSIERSQGNDRSFELPFFGMADNSHWLPEKDSPDKNGHTFDIDRSRNKEKL